MIEFSEKLGNAPDLRQIILVLIFAIAQPIFLLGTDTDDPVSVTWIAFNGKLMGFRIKIFKKQFFYLLFFCLFIHVVENIIAAFRSLYSVSHASLLRRCQGILYNLYFPVQQLVNFVLKICVTSYSR